MMMFNCCFPKSDLRDEDDYENLMEHDEHHLSAITEETPSGLLRETQSSSTMFKAVDSIPDMPDIDTSYPDTDDTNNNNYQAARSPFAFGPPRGQDALAEVLRVIFSLFFVRWQTGQPQRLKAHPETPDTVMSGDSLL